MEKSSANSKAVLLSIVILIACLAGIASDIYAPSLPAISASLKTPISLVQWSMAIYMLGLSLSQLIYGPLSDAFGRRPALALGLLIFLCGSAVCYFASDIDLLIYGRLIQGCGAGACAALWRSTFRDVFAGEELAVYGSYLSVIMVFVVPTAPALGGYFQEYFGWQSSFIFLAVYAVVALLMVIFLFKETSQHHDRSRLTPSFIIVTYGQLLKNRVFMGYTISVFLTYGAFFSWFAVGPILLIDRLEYSPVQFGWVSFAALGGAMALGSFTNARLVRYFGLYAMLRFGWSMTFAAGIMMLLAHWVVGVSALFIIIPVLMFYLGSTFIFANTFAGAFAKVGKIAGFAGALYGALQIAGASVLGAVVSYLPDNNQVPLACVYIFCTAAAWIVYKTVVRPIELADS
ncbi:MAG: multidrug effflux MFS transporter [Chlamydiales bacterium]|nr:multidrug effflux MFS transporter [Chlamydiales bacterium]